MLRFLKGSLFREIAPSENTSRKVCRSPMEVGALYKLLYSVMVLFDSRP